MSKAVELHTKEKVYDTIYRLAVPGGWLYVYPLNHSEGGAAMTFVPEQGDNK